MPSRQIFREGLSEKVNHSACFSIGEVAEEVLSHFAAEAVNGNGGFASLAREAHLVGTLVARLNAAEDASELFKMLEGATGIASINDQLAGEGVLRGRTAGLAEQGEQPRFGVVEIERGEALFGGQVTAACDLADDLEQYL